MFDPYEYTITLKKVILDHETWFEATVAELPDVAEYADNFAGAYQLAIDTIQTAMEMFAQENRLFPSPLPRRSVVTQNPPLSLNHPKPKLVTTFHRPLTKPNVIKSSGILKN